MTIVVLAAAVVGCGDGGDPDREELDSLRSDVTSDVAYESPSTTAQRMKTLLTDALDIAARNQGKPIGDEAFAFAQETFLRHDIYDKGPLFIDSAPQLSIPTPPPDDNPYFTDIHLTEYQEWLGFLAVVPAPYRATDVIAEIHKSLLSRLDLLLGYLGDAVATRQRWIDELRNAGSTQVAWSMENWEQTAAALTWYRDVAAKAPESKAVLRAFDTATVAAVVATFAPSSVETDYRNGAFVSTYTPEAVAAAEENLMQLQPAVAAAQAARAKAPAA